MHRSAILPNHSPGKVGRVTIHQILVLGIDRQTFPDSAGYIVSPIIYAVWAKLPNPRSSPQIHPGKRESSQELRAHFTIPAPRRIVQLAESQLLQVSTRRFGTYVTSGRLAEASLRVYPPFHKRLSLFSNKAGIFIYYFISLLKF